jgi:hypothetical protein
MPEMIKCPKCGTEIEVTKALSVGVAARLRSEILAEVAQKEATLAEREEHLKEQQLKMQATLQQRVEEEGKRQRKEALAQAREERRAELLKLNDELKKSNDALADARKAQATLKQKEASLAEREAQLSEQRAKIQATVSQRVEAERVRLRAEALKQAREENSAELQTLSEELKESKDAVAQARKAQAALKKRERELADREGSLEATLEDRLAQEREAIRAKAREQALKEAGKQTAKEKEELEEARRQLAEKEAQLETARQAERALLKQRRELDQKTADLELEVERRLTDGASKIREETRAAILETQRIKEKEKDEQIESLRRKIDELKQKAEQGSQQLQGEAQELVLEELLRSAFPLDAIAPVAKGVHGGDVLQTVRDSSGGPCGTILWESKRTKAWSDGWLAKVRDDRGEAKATVAVIVTQAMPAGCTNFDRLTDIWVTAWPLAVPLATALRSELIQVAAAKRAMQGQQGKMEMLYGYLSGPVFKNRVEGMVEAFKALKEDLDAEKRVTLRLWAKREQQLTRATAASSGFYGDLQGIIGGSLPELPSLSLALPPGQDGASSGAATAVAASNELDLVLQFLEGSWGEHSKGEILAGTGIPNESWPQLAQQLAAHPRVVRTGEKRGTRYAWGEIDG